jgi:hypothetical protein
MKQYIKNKETKFFILIFSIMIGIKVHAQNFEWAKSFGGSYSHNGSYSVTVDGSGNVYTIGYFGGTADFDPSSNTFNLTSSGGTDIFISKLDASGNFVWAKKIGGTGNDYGRYICTDPSGNLCITGYFENSADFDPNAGTFTLTSAGYNDIFILKLDADGNFIWAKSIGGAGLDKSYSIATDGLGNVYTTGSFQNTIDFDPGVGVFNLTPIGNADIFVCKLDANGNFVWAKNMGGSSYDEGNSIDVDNAGNVYVTGYFYGTADFDPTSGVFNMTAPGAYSDIFISKFDTGGNFIWAKQIGGAKDEVSYSINVDLPGYIHISGSFENTVDFDPGTSVFNLTSVGFLDMFVVKLDNNGNLVWAKQMGGSANHDIAYSVCTDTFGNVYTTGVFSGGDYDPGPGVYNLVGNGIFFSKLDIDGNFIWAKQITLGSYYMNTFRYCIVVDNIGNIHTAGEFIGSSDFDPGTGIFNLGITTFSYSGAFIHKMGQTATEIENIIYDETSPNIYPNPSNGTFYLNHIKHENTYVVVDITGKIVQTGTLINGLNIVNLGNLPNGFYLLRTEDKIFKLIKE